MIGATAGVDERRVEGEQMVQEIRLVLGNLIPRVVGRYSPVVVDRGEGIYVWDIDGIRWTDFTSELRSPTLSIAIRG